ncbi:Lcl C-terminal domain-containing protein [Hydrogenimonas sp.]
MGSRKVCQQRLGSAWRVPEIWELFELRGETERFGEGKRYWSGNTLGEARVIKMIRHESEYFVMNEEIPAFAFYLQDGDITPTPKRTKAHVICTDRTKRMPSSKGFRRLDDGRVVDDRNGLIWESTENRTRRNLKLDFESARAWCEERGMRLPDLDELYAIINYNYVKPAVDPAIFAPMHNKYYWSGEEFDENEGYVVGFAVGSVATSDKRNRSYFRCVEEAR